MNVTTVDPETGLVVDAFIPTLAAVPDGATYVGIFAVAAKLQILGGAAAGAYLAQRHVVDGLESVTPVIDFDISPTLTFMNRRYR